MERKPFKTKLCVLYQRGHCNRQSCSFAHGEAELRRFGGSSSGRRDYRGVDLRNRLGRRYSPWRRYTPIKNTRSHPTLRGYSPSRSLEDNSDRDHQKKHHLDSQSDVSGKASDGSDYAREGRSTLSDSKHTLQMQLKQVQSDISMLDHSKVQLEVYLEECDKEPDSLSAKIQELEEQVHREKKECRRINSRIKKFVKGHHRYSRLQDELKRLQIHLRKLGDQITLDAVEGGSKEEDSSINAVSDGDNNINHASSPWDELQTLDPSIKVPDLNLAAHEELQPHGRPKLSRWAYSPQKLDGEFYTLNGINSSSGLPGGEGMHNRDNHTSSAISSGDKVLPSAHTSADIIDETIVNMDPKLDSSRNKEAAALQNKRWSFAIAPIPGKRSYGQGDEENAGLVGGLVHTEKVDVTNAS